MTAKILSTIRKAVFQAHLQHSFTLVKMCFQSMTSGETSALVHKVIPKICGELYARSARSNCLFLQQSEKILINHGLHYRHSDLSTILFT